jgi:hypothetical protein
MEYNTQTLKIINSSVFRRTTPRSPLVSCMAYPLILTLEAKCSSETLVDFQRTARHYITDDRTRHNHRFENLRSYTDNYSQSWISVDTSRFKRNDGFPNMSVHIFRYNYWVESCTSPQRDEIGIFIFRLWKILLFWSSTGMTSGTFFLMVHWRAVFH